MKLQPSFLKLAFVTGLTFFSLVSQAGPILEIVNGRPVHAGESYSKHTVGLGEAGIVCTGVIIGAHHVITAGHCADDVQHGKIYFGTDKTNFEYRNVIDATLNPDYCKNDCGTLTSTDDHDIVILKFEGDLPTGFEPVEIAAKENLIVNTSIHLVGFGIDENGRFDETLKVAEAPFTSFNGVSEFRTDETKAGSCNGDSGGPAFISSNGQLQLAGITSRGDGPCRKLGIYTMVSYFSTWLSEVMRR